MIKKDELLWPLPDVSWIQPDRFAVGARPGHRPDPHPQVLTSWDFAVEYVNAIKDAGIKHIVCLLTESEMRKYYDFSLVGLYRDAGLGVSWSPMVPPQDRETFVAIVDEAAARFGTLVHCAGGTQRSGVVACCVMRKQGVCKSSNEARTLVEMRRGFPLHLQAEQRELVDWYFSVPADPPGPTR